MSPRLRLAAVWVLLAAGLVGVLLRIPMPGVRRAAVPPSPPAEALPPPAPAGGAEEQYGLGVIALGEGRLEDALACLDRAIALDPSNAVAYAQKAVALARSGGEADVLRRLLGEARRRGFDRDAALEREGRLIAQGPLPGQPAALGILHLERAVLLGFWDPPRTAEALEALSAARQAGASPPAALERALKAP